MEINYPNWLPKIFGSPQTSDEMNGIVEVLQNHAETLSLHDIRILAASSGIYTDALTPTSEVPTDVGDKVFLVTQPGTYTNFGNVVLPENNFGFIFKNGNSFSIQNVEMPMQDLTEIENNISEVNNKVNELTLFKKTLINIIDPSKVSEGYLNNGYFSSNPNFKCSDWIEVNPNDEIYIKHGLNWVIYDSNKKMLYKFDSFNFASFKVPDDENVKYVRFDTYASTTDWVATKNRELPSEYIPYGVTEVSMVDDERIELLNKQVDSRASVKELHINYFDKTKASIGYLNDEGKVSHHTNYFTSDFIRVQLNDVVAGSFGNYVFYDKDKKFISKHYEAGRVKFTVTNSEAKYVRIDNQIVYLDTEFISINKPEQPFYIPYELTQYSFESDNPIRYSWLTSKNRGKRWLTLGDSICNGVPHGYRQQTTMWLDLININHAKDGATIGYFENGARVISEYIDTITDDADIITVHAMVNDCSGGLPIGTWSDTTNTTFYGAYRMVAEKLLNKFTGKKIAFMTAVQRVNNTALKPYVNVIKEVGAFYGIPVLDLNATCGLYPDLQSYRQYYDNIGLHPNLEGHKIITPKVVDFINSI